ncbi:MAG: phosphatase PAP2 family protein [Bryobacterales bacterium]|nr:phosphatase PAP2 family protein [Bryobacterales bacterium]MBV9397560.1 phosphatase PAP2 family protein [Bryobacterales bacterium]
MPRFRFSEWLAIGYFLYVAAIAPFFVRAPWRPLVLAAAIAGLFWLAALCRPVVRDFAPLAAALVAYREMEWFTPAVQDHHLERVWVLWDRVLLDQYGLRAAIESAGRVLPEFLELCYVLVYAVAPIAVWVLYANGKGLRARQFWVAYLAATLGAYALFPYFPSEPPRIVFPGLDMPHVEAMVRNVNMMILGGYGIHSSVFPSAHVSSAFSAAWALLVILPEKRWIGCSFAGYAVCVAIATVYGRYHYGADALAGFAVSLVAFPALWVAGAANGGLKSAAG